MQGHTAATLGRFGVLRTRRGLESAQVMIVWKLGALSSNHFYYLAASVGLLRVSTRAIKWQDSTIPSHGTCLPRKSILEHRTSSYLVRTRIED